MSPESRIAKATATKSRYFSKVDLDRKIAHLIKISTVLDKQLFYLRSCKRKEPPNRELLRYVIAEAGDGREAIEKARVFHPDLMILDITMPQLNGLEAIPRIRKASPSTHILVLSMHDEEEMIHRTLEAGASGYILKSDAGSSL